MDQFYENQCRYQSFLIEEMEAQAEIERYINEGFAISEGVNTLEKLSTIQEGFIDSAKERLNKLAAFIKKMWAKFLEVLNRLVRTNASYLKNYKDTILKNKFNQDVSYDMYDWKVGEQNIFQPVNITFTDEKALVTDMSSKDNFISKHFGNVVSGYKAPYDFTEICKAYFRGGENQKTYNASDLDGFIRDMYDYCLNYGEKLKGALEKDYNAFMDQAGKLMDKLLTAQRNAPSNGGGQVQNNESAFWDDEKVYSKLLESYVTEDIQQASSDDIKKYGNKNVQQKDAQQDMQRSNSSKNNNQQSKPAGNSQNEPAKGSGATVKNNVNTDRSALQNTNVNGNGNSEEEIKVLGNAVSDYVDIMNTYLTCRMSAAEAMYKDFMIIIKDHVRNNVGPGNRANSTVGKMANGNNNGGNNQQQAQAQSNTAGINGQQSQDQNGFK